MAEGEEQSHQSLRGLEEVVAAIAQHHLQGEAAAEYQPIHREGAEEEEGQGYLWHHQAEAAVAEAQHHLQVEAAGEEYQPSHLGAAGEEEQCPWHHQEEEEEGGVEGALPFGLPPPWSRASAPDPPQ